MATSIVNREMKDGRFVRQANRFTDRIGTEEFPAEAGRYRLYASLACPWAHRALIVRRLLGLEDTIGVTILDPIRDERGWRFTLSPDDRDPITGAHFLAELYTATDPAYDGRHTVPCVWDTKTKRLVTNDYPEITLMLASAFARFRPADAPDLYPEELRAGIDELNDEVFHNVNNGVYKAGMAQTQEAYDEAFDALFATLDRLEARLEGHDYLVGDRLTEADVRLYPTLARFDAVYHGHFKCNLRRIADYPRLWAYARRLYAIPAFGATTDFDHIKRHYYETHRHLNPSGIVPKGPAISWT
ncbi:MAG TPA: glutathione S-transferase family protein [Actinoallomurus sp.]|jgi:putative glutathione S-transferase